MIAILLCTYNGEKYLSQQLDSLMAQTYTDFSVYCRDDGSTDSTCTIIKEYCERYPQKIQFVDDSKKNRGSAEGFMWLLSHIDAEYYMFCDQDDVWLPFKVEHSVRRIRELECEYPNSPILIHTDLKVCDEQLNVIFPSFWEYQNFKVDISKQKAYAGFGNVVTGCTVIINEKLKEVSLPYEGNLMHDYWLALRTVKFGHMDNLKESTILYRQHGNNVAGIGRQYRKNRIGYRVFFHSLTEERMRVKDITGFNFLQWFFYRVLYFFHRHFL